MPTLDVDRLLRYPPAWHLLPLWGTTTAGHCTCYKGAECTAPGKHPVERDWITGASNDEEQICDWFADRDDLNVGLLLGPKSMVIDIEFDDDRGKQLADKLLGGIQTPTYSSGRSVHRLFLWDESLPDVQKQIVNGLECRLGGGGKSTQSVLPPSRHHSGVLYEWLPGLSPEEVDMHAVIPELLALLVNQEDISGAERSASSNAQKVYDQATIGEGERDNVMLAYACQQAAKSRDIDTAEGQGHLWLTMVGINATKFSPPLSEAELTRLHRQAINYTLKDEAGKTETQAAYNVHGLEHRDGQWYPGLWQLTVVMSDPPEYQIKVPAWAELTSDGNGVISLTDEQFTDANKMAQQVLRATREIVLCDQPRRWPNIWNGLAATKDTPAGRVGLKKRLMDAREVVDPPAIAKRHVMLAEWFSDRIQNAEPMREGQTCPDDSATPTKMPDGSVWLRWGRVWQEGILSQEVASHEPNQLRDRLGLGKKQSKVHRDSDGKRRRFMVLEPTHLERLDKMTEIE